MRFNLQGKPILPLMSLHHGNYMAITRPVLGTFLLGEAAVVVEEVVNTVVSSLQEDGSGSNNNRLKGLSDDGPIA